MVAFLFEVSLAASDTSSPLENHCWVREAETEDGRQGWALIDSDGELEMFTENRSDVFFYIAKHKLVYVILN